MFFQALIFFRDRLRAIINFEQCSPIAINIIYLKIDENQSQVIQLRSKLLFINGKKFTVHNSTNVVTNGFFTEGRKKTKNVLSGLGIKNVS